ncbi:MAG: protein kinase domain-containing protein [Planctomycetaceae bacterium]
MPTTSLTTDQVDALLMQFDRSWSVESWTGLIDSLSGYTAASRRAVLIEALPIDLERRLRLSQTWRLEDYVGTCPEFCSLADFPMSVIRAVEGLRHGIESEMRVGYEGRGSVEESELMKTVRYLNSPPSVDSPVGRQFGNYELLEVIAQGGMGIVYRAWQRTLNRLVALKMMLESTNADPEACRRFRLEAESAAKLDHPGIVPIYEVGEHEGRHFFSMALIDGPSLAEQISDKRSREEVFSPFQAASILVAVARAVAHAHGVGIIHRDLKPANILIDQTGQPRVTDFGLAKQLSLPGHTTAEAPLTIANQIMGTPSYMPPEQASGDAAHVGPPADVYALGAMLYELVTGRPPFLAATTIATLRQVIENEPLSPRQLNSEIDRDCETICLKCLAKAPADRYASAKELADELDLYLAGLPIVARPISIWRRSGRWARRHRLVTSLLVVIVAMTLVGIGGTVLAFLRIQHETELAQAAGQQAKQQRSLAITTLRTVIHDMERKLMFVPGAASVRKEMVEAALQGLQNVAQQLENDPVLDTATASARIDLGDLYPSLGPQPEHRQQALQQFQIALSIAHGLIHVEPAEPKHRLLVGICYDRIAGTYAALDNLDEAENWNRRYVEHAERVLREFPDNPAVERAVAVAHERLGGNRLLRNRHQEAITHFERVLAIQSRLSERQPQDRGAQRDVTVACERLGATHLAMKQPAEALAYFRRDREITDRLVEPNNTLLSRDLFVSDYHLAETHHALGQFDEAIRFWQSARQRLEDALKLEPNQYESQRDWRDTSMLLAKSQQAAQKFSEARTVLEAVAAHARRMAQQHPDVMDARQGIVRVNVALVDSSLTLADMAYGEEPLTEALEIASNHTTRNPQDAGLHQDLADVHTTWGKRHESRGEFTKARDRYRQAASLLQTFREATGDTSLQNQEADVRQLEKQVPR